MSYTNTFIAVADDCPVAVGTVPPVRGEKPSVAVLQHELLAKSPYKHTEQELIMIVHVTRLGLSAAELKARAKTIHAELFSKPHPCLRASPLTKQYGWGAHYDEAGRIAIYARGSQAYAELEAGQGKAATVLKAMRNKRAGK
ncbi:MAG: DUF6157 family protein [Hyphomicrobiaceae bacterium]